MIERKGWKNLKKKEKKESKENINSHTHTPSSRT